MVASSRQRNFAVIHNCIKVGHNGVTLMTYVGSGLHWRSPCFIAASLA